MYVCMIIQFTCVKNGKTQDRRSRRINERPRQPVGSELLEMEGINGCV